MLPHRRLWGYSIDNKQPDQYCEMSNCDTLFINITSQLCSYQINTFINSWGQMWDLNIMIITSSFISFNITCVCFRLVVWLCSQHTHTHTLQMCPPTWSRLVQSSSYVQADAAQIRETSRRKPRLTLTERFNNFPLSSISQTNMSLLLILVQLPSEGLRILPHRSLAPS